MIHMRTNREHHIHLCLHRLGIKFVDIRLSNTYHLWKYFTVKPVFIKIWPYPKVDFSVYIIGVLGMSRTDVHYERYCILC